MSFRSLYLFSFIFALYFLANTAIAKNYFYIDEEGKLIAYLVEQNERLELKKITIDKNKLQNISWVKSVSNYEQVTSLIEEENHFKLNPISEEEFKNWSQETISEVDQKSIWKTENQWDENWEIKYSQWVSQLNVKMFFYYNKIATDCADVPIALRWIFSRINGLPAANHLDGSAALFSNQSFKSNWINLKTSDKWQEDKLFLAALNYVLDNTSSYSLIKDSYPIAINPLTLTAGSHHIEIRPRYDIHHTITIDQVDPLGLTGQVMSVQNSTVPRQVRILEATAFWYKDQPTIYTGGFLKIRWPELIENKLTLRAKNLHPGYSLEQYQAGFMKKRESFSKAVMRRLTTKSASLIEFNDQITALKASIESRVQAVEEGYRVCGSRGCPSNSSQFDNHSTPSRDKRILGFINQIKKIINENEDNTEKELMIQSWNKTLLQFYVIIEKRKYNLKQLVYGFENDLVSSNPNDPVKVRWGINY